METDSNTLARHLEHLGPLIGDRQTGRTVGGTAEGITASESLKDSQIAAFSP